MKTDPRLPYTEIDDSFLPPRDPVLGFVKCGGKEATIRYARATGRPWVAPTRFLNPARFEITTREKRTEKVKGHGKASGEDFIVDLGYVRDDAFHEIEGVGSSPSSLRVRLLYPRWNQNLIAFLGAYGGGAWVCRGNGVQATDEKSGDCSIPCPCPRLKQFSGTYDGDTPNDGVKYKDGNAWKYDGVHPCKPHAQLNVMLEDAGIFGGFWAFKTTSYETISNLKKSLRMFEEVFRRIDGLPFELRVMAATKQIPGGGTTTQPIVTVVLPANMDTARQLAADAAAESRKFLPAGRELDHETYLEAVISEMEEEAETYAGEFLPAEVIEEEKEGRGDGPDGSGGRHPSPPDDPNQEEDEDELDDDIDGGEGDREAGHVGGGGDGGRERARPRSGAVSGERGDTGPRGAGEVEAGGPDRDDPSEAVDDSDRNDPEEELEEYDVEDYQLATKVLEAAGWKPDAIEDRLAYHVKTGTLLKLLERLERHHPEAWAELADPDEPEDGLAS